jgi:hypothetical protein
MPTTNLDTSVKEGRFSAAYRATSRMGLQPLCLLCLLAIFAPLLSAQSSQPAAPPAQKEAAPVSHTAKGAFDVKIAPQPTDDKSATPLGRMTLDKQYHGDLEATAKGEMLTGATTVKGSGVYVAVERVEGTLQGRHGTFLMHHTGLMTRGVPQLSINIVPDSGTGELTGITGTMDIQIDAGKHSYVLKYTLPESK